MAVLVSIATGNFTDASTWGVVDATSYLNDQNATESLLTTAYSGTRSAAFTPGAITISHIGVKLCERIGTTGTISVCLELDSGDTLVAGTEVTINVADLPSVTEANLAGGWIFFKLASPVTLSAATAYQVAAKTSSATMVDLWCNGTADNLSRALVTTTTAAPGAGDDLIVAGEKTGAGTGNSFTVTNNNTATTDFGSAPTAANSLITPGLAICHGGTFQYGTTAATNYYLKMSNTIIVYAGGTLNIGTTGTPIPRDSTAVLEFDPGTDGDYGLIARNLGTLNIQGLSRTSGKNIVACKLNTDEAANSTSLGVDTDTGWLDNDQIAVASTTRTPTNTEAGTLNGNAGASSLTVDGFGGAGGGLANAHSGTSPTQAEVILITRNIKIRSATSTLMAYVNCHATSVVDIDWAEFYYLGENATSKRGIEVATTSGGSFNIQYSSIHDTEDGALYLTGATGSVVVSNNTFYNTNTAITNNVYTLSIAATSGAHTITNNTLLAPKNSASSLSGNTVNFADYGSNFSNNTIAGATSDTSTSANSAAILFNSNGILDTFQNNLVHSSNGAGMYCPAGLMPDTGTIDGLTVYRNTSRAISNQANNAHGNLIFLDCTFFGNQGGNVFFDTSGSVGLIIFDGCISNSDASFSTTTGYTFNGSPGKYLLIDCIFSSITAHTNDINISASTIATMEIELINCSLAGTNEVANSNNLNFVGFVRSHKNDQSATTFKNYYRFGTIQSDQTIRHTASGYSWKLTPNSATRKLLLPGPTMLDTFKAAVNASSLVTITAYVYKDSSYNGNAPRLVIVGGILDGIASDVIDSLTVAHSNWEQLSVQATPNEAGVIEYYIDCDGTAGNVYVDDITITQA